VVGLEKVGELITVGTLRVFGNQVAELPLVGTRFAHRRQGMCRLLVTELEKMLRQVGVRRLVLPAVPELLPMWTASLGFHAMTRSDVMEMAVEHAILSFKGTTMCQKTLLA
jgi:N-acetylglutamate synthase-like GNAT family acetyltransferase